MSEPACGTTGTLRSQGANRDNGFHPSVEFIEFKKAETEQSISARFEQQVSRYPDRIAVRTQNQEISYQTLNGSANRIARAILAQQGNGGEPVALLLQDGLPMIEAILGTLKAGKIFVPLDVADPYKRLAHILQDLQARIVVTDSRTLPLADELAQSSCQVIDVQNLASGLSSENLGLEISPDFPARISYTSGSTGRPKGVVHNHRNILHTAMIFTNAIRICANDRLSMLSPIHHLAGTSTVCRALLNGAALTPFNIRERGIADLASWLIEQRITVYQSVPTVFRHMVDTLNGEEEFHDLRSLHLGGEAVTVQDVELYKKHFPATCVLLHNLGSTEVHAFCQYFITTDTEIPGHIVPVGYPVQDKEVLLLDENGEPAGFDRLGEIAVRSRYLAQGYWRKPELTRTVFLPDPASKDKRICLTGDLGLMRPDGCLEHHGRIDSQVKIRGHRVEATEVELALLGHESVRETAVVVQDVSPGERRLVAYVSGTGTTVPQVSELRDWLADKLPSYMIPSSFVLLDALPLTTSGKVDRLALSQVAGTSLEAARDIVAPRTPIEEVLGGIWARVLGLGPISVHDNFFDLGGNSLLATQVNSRLRDTVQIELPLSAFFERPTIAELAEAVERAMTRGDGVQAPDLAPLSRDWRPETSTSPGSERHNL